ncbi:MAG: N-acetylmuramidase domain-containing protein [Allorhizobium sp.]
MGLHRRERPELHSRDARFGELRLNFELCGFANPQALVSKCPEGEVGQLDVMTAFITGNGLGAALRRRDRPAFARGMGARYAENTYDVKLARAHGRLSAGATLSYYPLADGVKIAIRFSKMDRPTRFLSQGLQRPAFGNRLVSNNKKARRYLAELFYKNWGPDGGRGRD